MSPSHVNSENWNLGAKWRFVGGSPYTPWDLNRSSLIAAWDARKQGYLDYSNFNTFRTGNFQQLDVRIDKQYFLINGHLIYTSTSRISIISSRMALPT